jgi:adenylate cyclase
VVGIDMPAICVIQLAALQYTTNTVVVALIPVGIYVTLLMVVAMMGLSWLGLGVATMVAIVCESLLCRSAGMASDAYQAGLVLVMVTAAVAAAFVGRQVLGLV